MSAGICGCAQRFELPMTAAEAAAHGTGAALVAYLGQPDASASMCDLRGTGPHLFAVSPDKLVPRRIRYRVEHAARFRLAEHLVPREPCGTRGRRRSANRAPKGLLPRIAMWCSSTSLSAACALPTSEHAWTWGQLLAPHGHPL
jgi:hypothetical protein